MKISIVLPSVRTNRLERFVNSIDYEDYELIIVSPYDLPPALSNNRKITLVKDWGSPTRASQIGLLLCTGDLVIWSVDDSVLKPGMLQQAKDLLVENGLDAILTKYTEGGDGSYIQHNGYFTYGAMQFRPNVVAHNAVVFYVGLCKREMMEEMGGWDCKFQATPLAHADFGIRAYAAQKYKIAFSEMVIAHCDSCDYPDNGDHTPIERAQSGPDAAYYRSKYNGHFDINIDINNWKKSDRIWKERFE